MQRVILEGENDNQFESGTLQVIESSIEDLLVEGNECVGIRDRDGIEYRANCVVLTTGTFLGGLCHIGEHTMPAGRFMRTK